MEVAEHFHFNPAYFSSLFKKQAGVPLGQYILDIRMTKARELLLETDLKIYEIARAVGFLDNKYFIRVFTKENGVSPGTFRATRDPCVGDVS